MANNYNNRGTRTRSSAPAKNTKPSGNTTPRRRKKATIDTATMIQIFSGIIAFALALKILGLLFTIILVAGIGIIVGCSKLLVKLRKKKSTKIISNIAIIILLMGCIAVTIIAGGFFLYVVQSAPSFDVSKLNRSESTQIFDSENKLIAELGTEKREKIKYEQMSQVFIDALVATEDARFFQHNGFDSPRFMKATLGQLMGKPGAGGASTLSMQVIKNSFTSVDSTGFDGLVRKFTDIYLAMFKLEKTYTKQEIIEFYVNNHYLGAGAYGVEQASITYFGKKAKDLNLAEAATIVGLFQSPNAYNPFSDPEAATKRRNTVLNLMYKHGYISVDERDLAKAIPIESLLVSADENEIEYQAYIDTVIEEVIRKYGVNPYNTPMLIYTNMKASKQKGLDNIFNGKTFQWENKMVQAGVAAVDVWSGKIIAVGAGRNRNGARTYNYATDINRQIGSTAKPIFDYGPGIEYNNWSTYEQFNDEPYTYSSGQPMRNADRQYWGWMSLRTALAQSRNVPALKAFRSVDNAKIVEFVTKLGIKPEISNGRIHEAHSIGAFNGSNPLKMAAAYAAFANGGTYYEPYAVNKVIFRNTGEEKTFAPEGVKVMSDATAFMITDCLATAVKSGLSSGAAVSGANVAAKTGTSNYTEEIARKYGLPWDAVNDAWIIGYDPDTAIGLWYGYEKIDKNYYSTALSGVIQRGRVFRAAGDVLFNKNGKNFAVPNSVIKVGIEKGSVPATLPSPSTPENQIIYEWFKRGTEPTETSEKYIKLANVTNLTASYNPSSLSVTLNWSAAKAIKPKDEYGPFGYKIYKDGVYLGFTTNTYFTVSGESNPWALYKVVTTYENYAKLDSSGSQYKLIEPEEEEEEEEP